MAETADTKTVVVTPAALQEYARAIFVGAGAPDTVARRVAGERRIRHRVSDRLLAQVFPRGRLE